MRVSFVSVLSSSLAVACALVLSPTDARAASKPVTYCGEELDQAGDYHLDADLGPCSGHGIVITASDVRLALAGHTLSGVSTAGGCAEPQIGIDVRNPATNVKVGGGTVTGFADGVSLTGGSRATALRVVDNCGFGILVAGTGAKVDTNIVSGSVDGIAVCNARQALVTSNEVFGNSRYGVLLSCGQGQDDENHVVQNILRENGLPGGDGGGMGVFSGNLHRIASNNVTGNFLGISIATSEHTTIEDNTVNANANAGIVLGAGAGHTNVLDNTAYGNGVADMQDDAAGCGTNVWTPNLFSVDIVDGLPDGGPDVPCIQ